jgi:cleavage stimulation factor subunit 3
MKIEEARVYYESFLSDYPTAGKYWKSYAEHEINEKNYDKAEKIFERCLMHCLNIDLWKCYLSYVKTIKSETKERNEIIDAYNFKF